MLTTGIHMDTTDLSKIQRQSIHECIIECHQLNSTPPIYKDEYFEISLSILESVAGFETCDDSELFNALETIYSDFNSKKIGD
jgi:hypothetical protein